jgi:NNP family nitrate/nitrite transporter-like MFS transporter
MVMPLIFAAVIFFGAETALGWRMAMVIPGVAMFLTGIAYYFFTQDAPNGNYKDLRARGEMSSASGSGWESFKLASKDYRVWALFIIYAACFGIELTINNVAALYYYDEFSLDIKTAGMIAGLFGLMNIFARTLGGAFSDKVAVKGGLTGRVRFMAIVLLLEGLALILFSQMTSLILSVSAMLVFSLFVKMAEGATYAIVPFMNKKALGAVAGIVGAGGNAGAVAAGFLFRAENLSTQDAFFYLGVIVAVSSVAAMAVQFTPEILAEEKKALEMALAERAQTKELQPAI